MVTRPGDVVLKRVASLAPNCWDHGWVCLWRGRLVVLFANPDIHFCQMLLEQYRIKGCLPALA